MRTSGKVLKDFDNLRKALFDEKISHIAFMRDGKVEILYTQKYVDKLEQEIERLNNIVAELEKYHKIQMGVASDVRDNQYCLGRYDSSYDSFQKIQELKGDGSND